jgi:hypothetical protein
LGLEERTTARTKTNTGIPFGFAQGRPLRYGGKSAAFGVWRKAKSRSPSGMTNKNGKDKIQGSFATLRMTT